MYFDKKRNEGLYKDMGRQMLDNINNNNKDKDKDNNNNNQNINLFEKKWLFKG